jgi:CelD/BcsL family acetyltransferase involved in cellulose biosynthesis
MVLDLPASWSSFHAGLPRNIRESLRKCYNSLRRDGHELELRVIERPEQVSAALECFFALHAARAGVAQGIAHRNTFAEPAARHFLKDFLGQVAERGQLRLFQLEIGGAVRATRIGFQFGDELYLYYSGYDPDWGKYSIMTTTLAEAIRWAIAQGVRLVNLSTGIDVSKTRWRPREVRYAEAVQIAPTLRSRMAFQALEAARRGSSDASLLGQLLTLSRRHKIRRTIRPDR